LYQTLCLKDTFRLIGEDNYGKYLIGAVWCSGCLTPSWLVLSLVHIKGSRYFIEQETLSSLLSTGWFQEGLECDLHIQLK